MTPEMNRRTGVTGRQARFMSMPASLCNNAGKLAGEHRSQAGDRPRDWVADFFMGSGSTIKAALSLGRRAIGVELEEERFNQTVSEIKMSF